MKIQPFKAVRGKPNLIEKISCLPYDVVTIDDIKHEAGNPYSFFHVTRAEIDMPGLTSFYDKKVYEKAAQNLQGMISQGYLIQDPYPSFYIYTQEFQGRRQTGLVALFNVEDYENEVIKKHELTRPEKENDRIEHLLACQAHTEPVFLTFKAPETFKLLIQRFRDQVYDFTSQDGVRHKLWINNDKHDIEEMQKLFLGVKNAYIADGHHRAAAAAKVSQQTGVNYFLAVIFPEDDLKILPYHRVVKDDKNRGLAGIYESAREHFSIEDSRGDFEPSAKHVFGIYANGSWKKLTLKTNLWQTEDPVKSLDVYAIQEYFLKPIFGITDPRTDRNIDFIGGIKGVKAIEKYCDANPGWIGVSMFPTMIEEVMRVSDEGLIMPPKSTWFEPKLRSGLFLNLFR